MTDYPLYMLILIIIVYSLVFAGMRIGKQSFLVSLMWPGMLGVLLAEKLHERDARQIERERIRAQSKGWDGE
ncbi:hypothetical protein ELH48_09060 [Rhizobium ruizarguesonis]|uniref:hypothetical protein n=1 Tax=Rhizobium TaxID=379 RepID=UPI001030673B|nr:MULTISPECIES: hypothetical protein [Rhizobium]TAY66507.1 hypothetical protein ELH82_10040 [Rhizobium leguminosarum]TBB27288.1 hypothetical protein ELH48_09060 [Rhizobium ruizarguesonis]TBF35433.1 hypothetical protein ELG88_09510 [Rhizobium leguminosarum]